MSCIAITKYRKVVNGKMEHWFYRSKIVDLV